MLPKPVDPLPQFLLIQIQFMAGYQSVFGNADAALRLIFSRSAFNPKLYVHHLYLYHARKSWRDHYTSQL
jgi:hypothetical protein